MLKELKALDILILFLTLLMIILSLKLINRSGDYLIVDADGVRYEFPLDKDGIYSVKGSIGISKIEIKDGKARMISSPCPNKSCISSGYGNTITCLPNKVIANIGDSDVDEAAF